MIADGLDRISAPSTNVNNKLKTGNKTKQSSTTGAGQTNSASFMATSSSEDASLGRLIKFLVSSSTARFSRPGILSIIVQVLVNGAGGHLFCQAFVLPHLGNLVGETELDKMHDTVVIIIWLSCLLAPIFELFSSINEAELHYSHYSLVGGSTFAADGQHFHLQPVVVSLANDVIHCVRRSILGTTLLAPLIAAATIILWSHLGPLCLGDRESFMLSSPSYFAIMQSLVNSYLTVALLVTIITIQDVLTRWSVCAPGMDPDVLMFESTATSKDADEFLSEDLFVQSILDGPTAKRVITPPEAAKWNQTNMLTNQEDEISRNEIATTLFAEWIQKSSTNSSGSLADDILRMCLLESLGGGGSRASAPSLEPDPFYFGHPRHFAAVRKRLDLSAATASPGHQPIAVPIVRALCAFAGGLGDAMRQIYRQLDKDGKPLRKNHSAELWKLPPGLLNASEFAIVAAVRLVVMNSVMIDRHGHVVVDASKRHERLSLLLPCLLQSAYKLRCGVHEYARATANMYDINLSTYSTNGEGDGLGNFIVAKCAYLCPLISACNDSAKMALKTLLETGQHTLEDVLLRRKWKGDMQKWLVGLNCDDAHVAKIASG